MADLSNGVLLSCHQRLQLLEQVLGLGLWCIWIHLHTHTHTHTIIHRGGLCLSISYCSVKVFSHLVSRGGQGVKGEVVCLFSSAGWREELAVRGRDPVGLQVVGDSDASGFAQLEQPLCHVTVGG